MSSPHDMNPAQDDPDDPNDEQASGALAGYAREHPAAVGMLCVAVVAGAFIGDQLFAEYLSPVRRVIGGALAGFGCWLLVMVGRVLGE